MEWGREREATNELKSMWDRWVVWVRQVFDLVNSRQNTVKLKEGEQYEVNHQVTRMIKIICRETSYWFE